MQAASATGVLSHLSRLEVHARSRKTEPQQRSRVTELKAAAEQLRMRREQLRAEVETHKNLQKLRTSMDKRREDKEGEEGMDEDSEDSELLRLMARHTQLNDLLYAHHIIGGYDAIKTRQGQGLCLSLPTAYDGVFLETYNLEIDVKPAPRIARHNIPPFIPLSDLVEQSDMKTDIRAFLDTLSQHLNAFSGRKQQLKLVKELHKSVEVMESNALCSILVMMVTVPNEKTAILCTLDYTDHTRCLPTRVHFECNGKPLADSPDWDTNRSLLLETPVHKALSTMRRMGNIV
ncbi:Centromere protein O [Larimichthys crocea]|uniref:Centromere protein O n=1 Tax=Larimichthys crocea TaxID=215358 RepID=A0A6G0IFV7_LARCR|nr:Centromere protein O [Larimichthys crocea]